MMVPIAHINMVATLSKPGKDILDTLTARKVALWHMATGVAGEAGEVLDLIKKHVVYDKPLDMEALIEELGDIEFYMEGLRQEIKTARETILTANINKLNTRYENLEYSDSAAINQADKGQDTMPEQHNGAQAEQAAMVGGKL